MCDSWASFGFYFYGLPLKGWRPGLTSVSLCGWQRVRDAFVERGCTELVGCDASGTAVESDTHLQLLAQGRRVRMSGGGGGESEGVWNVDIVECPGTLRGLKKDLCEFVDWYPLWPLGSAVGISHPRDPYRLAAHRHLHFRDSCGRHRPLQQHTKSSTTQ